jgi:hypothetical protein
MFQYLFKYNLELAELTRTTPLSRKLSNITVQAVEAAGNAAIELDGVQPDSGGVKPVGRDALRQQTQAGLRIRTHFIRIRIQHFRINTDLDPDPGLQ